MTYTERLNIFRIIFVSLPIIYFFTFCDGTLGLSEVETKMSNELTKIIVVRNETRFYLYEHDKLIKSYLVSVGNANMGKAIPVGRFIIVSKVKEPSMMWRSGKKLSSNDPRNSYGVRWMGLARYNSGKYRGYGIQGTNVETSIGKQITIGSI